MCALTPPLFSNFGWPLDTPIGHEQINYVYPATASTEFTEESLQYFPPTQPQILLDRSASFSTATSGNPSLFKKLNHNASERDRRKKINGLYSSLRSLLPPADQMKQLSIPATVSHVVKYIPELQREVERLIQKKEEILSRISKQGDCQAKQRKGLAATSAGGPSPAISASRLSDCEVVIQICTFEVQKSPLSDMLLDLEEEEGLLLENVTSFESFEGRIFYNLHFQVESAYRLEAEALCEKLLSLYKKRENILLP